MSSESIKLPLYAKGTIILLGLIAIISILFVAKAIIIPLIFAVIIAIVLHPVVMFLVKLKINRVAAIVITIFLTFLVIVSFGALLISQIGRFSDSWPALVDRFTSISGNAIDWISNNFDINPHKITDWIEKTRGDLVIFSTGAIGKTLVVLGSALVVIFLLPVYIFLILFYEPILIEFIKRLFGSENREKAGEIAAQIKTVIQRYLVGLTIEVVIMATLETASLLILGIEYAFLLGIIGALLNVIPYIGGLVAVALPMTVALATKSSPAYAFYILIIYYIIQVIDNNYIVPRIVASKVKINALFSIAVVIAGNALWGIPGMFLSIPLLAIVKLICDHIESLKPWGFLLGDTMPPILKVRQIFGKRNIKVTDSDQS
jgi:predicted PurR-regulated permease PerM